MPIPSGARALFATPADVAARVMRPLSDVETTASEVMLAEVSDLIRMRVPDIATRIADGRLAASVAAGVAARAVARVLQNPDGKVQESIDDYAYRRSDAVADGALRVLADDWPLLAPEMLASPGGAYTVCLWG